MKHLSLLAVLILAACPSNEPDAVDASVDAPLEQGCEAPLACPDPVGDRFMLCGRLVNTETSELLSDPTDDPTKLYIGFYDALAFAANPESQPEFTIRPDKCGRFISADATHGGVTVPATSFLAVGVDDDAMLLGQGDFALTSIGVAGVKGGKLDGQRVYATQQATDAKWSGALSPSFIEQGVYLAIFIDTSKPAVGIYPGTPAAGVTITSDGSANASNDFYFKDTNALVRSSVEPTQNVTGVNGAGLFVNGPLVPYSGMPDPSATCKWPSTLAKTSPKTVYVQEQLCAP